MWDINNLWLDAGRSTSVAPCTPMSPMCTSYRSVMDEIHVLLVDHQQEDQMNTSKVLQLCEYRVTLVCRASEAMRTLAIGKSKFDVIMADINSLDLHADLLVQQALIMGIVIIFTSSHGNASVAKKTVEMGALLCLEKPVPVELMRILWQHVLREKGRMLREKERLMAENCAATQNIEEFEQNQVADTSLKRNVAGWRKGEIPEGYYMLEGTPMRMGRSKVKRKMCMEWTPELHAKFMEAVDKLGEGKCFPKEILELMGVPGLNRMQVASHLQKCRNDNWRSPEGRKPVSQGGPNASTSSGRHRPKRFGLMPQMATGPSCLGHESTSHAPTNTVEPGNLMNNGDVAAIHHSYGTMLPLPATGTSTMNPRQDDLFTDLDTLDNDFFGLLQGYPSEHES